MGHFIETKYESQLTFHLRPNPSQIRLCVATDELDKGCGFPETEHLGHAFVDKVS